VLGGNGRLGQMLQWGWQDKADLEVTWHTRHAPKGPAQNASWVIGDPLHPTTALLEAGCCAPPWGGFIAEPGFGLGAFDLAWDRGPFVHIFGGGLWCRTVPPDGRWPHPAPGPLWRDKTPG